MKSLGATLMKSLKEKRPCSGTTNRQSSRFLHEKHGVGFLSVRQTAAGAASRPV
jgi:hypothetical protein